jgi:RHS repeat-associated protein
VLGRFFPQGESWIGPTASTNYYYTKDHLGSIREVLDANGNLINRYTYDPFGQHYASTTGFRAAFGFTGDFVHQQSGLYLTWFRQLDSTTGRWLSRDPLGEGGGMDLYSYVYNNPINGIDPNGDATCRQWACIGGACFCLVFGGGPGKPPFIGRVPGPKPPISGQIIPGPNSGKNNGGEGGSGGGATQCSPPQPSGPVSGSPGGGPTGGLPGYPVGVPSPGVPGYPVGGPSPGVPGYPVGGPSPGVPGYPVGSPGTPTI